MNFSFSGSTGDYWKKFAKNFNTNTSDIAKFGQGLTTSLSQGRDYLATQGGEILHQEGTGDFNKGLKNMSNVGQHWSEQLDPLWEGGLSGTEGSFHQDLLPWMEGVGMKGSHMLHGTKYFAASDSDGDEGSSAAVAANTEDPSLVNQGNWKRANSIESILRREEKMGKGTLYHQKWDMNKGSSQSRGRLSAANLS